MPLTVLQLGAVTIVTYGSDGTKHVVVTKSNLFRDSRGRIRVEQAGAPGVQPAPAKAGSIGAGVR